MKAEIEIKQATSKRNTWNQQKLEEARKNFLLEPLEVAGPCLLLVFVLLVSRTVKRKFLLF